jgi:hypothetical protein
MSKEAEAAERKFQQAKAEGKIKDIPNVNEFQSHPALDFF